MRCGEAHLVAYFAAIHVDGGLYVRPFQEEHYPLVFPVTRHVDGTPIPGCTYIVAFRCEEERELHIVLLAVALHVGIKVIRRIIERPRPLRLHAYRHSLTAGKHGARQHHVLLGGIYESLDSIGRSITHIEVPRPSKVDDGLSPT